MDTATISPHFQVVIPRHLANANKKDHIRRINAMMNLPTPEIITPLELFQEEKNDRSITFIR